MTTPLEPLYEFDKLKMKWLLDWAEKQECRVNMQGQVGFGRNCVGIMHGKAYADLPIYGTPEYEADWGALPFSPKDSYHKHDCLAVLVLDYGYFPATLADDIYGDDGQGKHRDEIMAEKDFSWVDPVKVNEAFEQLYDWCRRLDAAGFEVAIRERQTYNTRGTFGAELELLMGGNDQAYLVRKNR